jgi:hypothetical protein
MMAEREQKSIRLHGSTCQKTMIFIVNGERALDLSVYMSIISEYLLRNYE